MAKENVKKFIALVNTDQNLFNQIEEQLKSVTDGNAIVEQLATFGEKVGLPFTPAEYKMESKKVSLDQLDNVAGGTSTETEELNITWDGLGQRRNDMLDANKADWKAYITSNEERWLDALGIEAKISTGFLNTGLGSKNNTYRDKKTGQMILHSEVIDYLKTGEKTWRK